MKRRLFLGALAAMPLLAACGGESSKPAAGANGSAGAGGSGLLTVGMIPVAHFAPLYIAQDQGFFKAEGLEVKTQIIQNAASIVPSVINGQLSFGTSAGTPFINGVAKKLPILAVAPAGADPATPAEDTIGVLVNQDGPKTLADLAGQTLAVNAQGSQPHIALSKILKEAGVDASSVQIVAMPMADALAALNQGRVGAVAVAEPFVTMGISQGARLLSPLYSLAFKNTGAESVYFASKQFIESNRAEVDAFSRALVKANQLANQDRSVLVDVLVNKLDMDSALAKKMVVPTFATELKPETLMEISDVMVETGFLTESIPAENLVLS